MAMHLLVRLNVLIVLSSPQVSGRVVVSDFSHWHQECYVNRSYTLFTSWLNSTYVRQPLDWCRVCVAGWIREAVTVSLCYSAVIKSVVVVSAFCLFVVWQSRFWWYRRESCVTFIVSFLLVVMCHSDTSVVSISLCCLGMVLNLKMAAEIVNCVCRFCLT